MPDTYGLDCPVARTLDVIGERWSVLLLRDLFLQGPRKFQDFESSLSGISPNTLSARLKRLEEGGIIERQFIPKASDKPADDAGTGAELAPKGGSPNGHTDPEKPKGLFGQDTTHRLSNLRFSKTSLERVFSIRHPYNQFENARMLIGCARTKKEHQLK